MARKINKQPPPPPRHLAKLPSRLIFLIVLAFLFLFVNASVLRITPLTPTPLAITPSGSALALNSPVGKPTNIQISLIPSSASPDSIKISWDKVPGAREYKVYSGVAIPDSSVMYQECEYVLDPSTGGGIWKYIYSYHPKIGDVKIINTDKSNPSYSVSANTKLITTWSLDTTGRFDGASYIRPYSGERDRFFRVTAIR